MKTTLLVCLYFVVRKFQADGLVHWEKEKEAKPTPSKYIWWNPYYRAPAADIEMTAYALMTHVLLAQDDVSLIGEAMSIVRWLTKQRNALGGFSSTQVGLDNHGTYLFVYVILYNDFATVDAVCLSTSNSQNASKFGKNFSCAAHYVVWCKSLSLTPFNVICVLQGDWRTAKWILFVKQRLFVYLFSFFN